TTVNLLLGVPSNAHGWMRAKHGRRSYALALAGSVLRGTHYVLVTSVENRAPRISLPSRSDDDPARPVPAGDGRQALCHVRVAPRPAERQRRDRVYRADRRHAEDARRPADSAAVGEPPAVPAHSNQPYRHTHRAHLA